VSVSNVLKCPLGALRVSSKHSSGVYEACRWSKAVPCNQLVNKHKSMEECFVTYRREQDEQRHRKNPWAPVKKTTTQAEEEEAKEEEEKRKRASQEEKKRERRMEKRSKKRAKWLSGIV
jgi:hypothetical protein